METFLKETSFHGIQLDTLFITPQSSRKLELQNMVTDSIKSGAVKPLCTTVFKEDQVEQAFRYMASGKHIGKVLVKIRDDDSQTSTLPKPVKMLGKNRFFCKNDASYIIIGGLGGFGLELGDWLALRGCRNLVLTSRGGLRSGYQAMRIRIWKSYGVRVLVSTVDVTSEAGATRLLELANSLAPVAGIFNLAVVLKDALFENQTPADFEASAGPKAVATKLLDKLSRKMCPSLDHFVIFSSVSCGRGNAGQTNYGLSNSVMERVCEQRQADGLPALAVQWGAVGEVGLVADMQEDNLEVVIGGTLQQRINSCLEVLDGFMFCPYPVVASMVVAEKRAGGGVAGNIVDTVVNILGLRDLKTISLHSTLAELGMDSMMAVEIKQTLEREFQVFLTPQDIRGMTFAKLQDLAAQAENESTAGAPKVSDVLPDFGINHLLRVVGDEMLSGEPILRLPSLCGDGKTIEEISNNDELIFLIPGIEGVASVVEPLAKNLKAQALCLQFDYEKTYGTIADIAESLIPHIKKRLRPGASLKILGYSFGAMVALEIVQRLEAEGRRGHVWLVDGAPDFLQALSHKTMHVRDEQDGFQTLQIQLIHRFMDLIWPQSKAKFESELLALPDWDARVEYLVKMAPEGLHSKRFQRLSMNAAYHRILAVFRYKPLPDKCLASSVTLIRPSEMAMAADDDYGLSKYCQLPVTVHFVEGNHLTILDNKKTADLVNKPTMDDAVGFKQSIMSTATNSLSSLQNEVKQQ